MATETEKQMVMQTLILSKETFPTREGASKWVRDHDFKVKAGAPDETGDSWRFRQREPGDFQDGTLRTIEVTDGVKGVVGRLKEEKMTKNEEAAARGNALLLPLNLTIEDVHELEFAVDKFRAAPAARSWAENHGMPPREIKVRADVIHAEVVPEDAFEFTTLRRERISRDISAVVGTRREVPAGEPVLRAVPDAGDPKDEPSAVAPSAVTKRGELYVRKAEEGEDEGKQVRMFGIVMKPEVPDIEGDVTAAEEIRRANERFMREFQTVGFMHKKDVSEKVKIIQNVIAPVDFEFPLPDGGVKKIAEGTWYQELFTDDPELVKRVREKKLNGLSIGGFARRVPVEGDGPKEDEGEARAEKRAPEHLEKAEGDPAKSRFVDLRVEEVSIVDAAANEEEFFIVKRRREDMSTKHEGQAAPTETAKAAPPPQAAAPVTTPPAIPPAPPAAAVTPPAVTPPAPEPTVDVQKAVESAVDAAVAKRLEGLPAIVQKAVEDGLAGVNKKLEEQGAVIGKMETVRAVAKGESVPDATTRPPEPTPATKSKWAGSAVHSVVQRAQKRNPA
jgi:hypothetical protein